MKHNVELDIAYAKYAKLWELDSLKFPYGTRPDDNGGTHIEYFADRKITLWSSDRGKDNRLIDSYEIDEILLYIFKRAAKAYGMQIAFEKRLAEGWDPLKRDDRRIGFPLALERIGQISKDWRERLEKELNEILERAPYND